MKLVRFVIESGMRAWLVTVGVFIMAKYTAFNFDTFDGWIFKFIITAWVLLPCLDFYEDIKKEVKKK